MLFTCQASYQISTRHCHLQLVVFSNHVFGNSWRPRKSKHPVVYKLLCLSRGAGSLGSQDLGEDVKVMSEFPLLGRQMDVFSTLLLPVVAFNPSTSKAMVALCCKTKTIKHASDGCRVNEHEGQWTLLTTVMTFDRILQHSVHRKWSVINFRSVQFANRGYTGRCWCDGKGTTERHANKYMSFALSMPDFFAQLDSNCAASYISIQGKNHCGGVLSTVNGQTVPSVVTGDINL